MPVKPPRNAFHEAGHLVVGDLCGYRFSSASINHDDGSGCVNTKPSGFQMSRETIVNDIAMMYGGVMAEMVFFNDIDDSSGNPESDFDKAEKLAGLLKLSPEETENVLQDGRARAWDMVHAHSARLEYIARVLGDQTILNEQQIDNALHGPIVS